jgi:hypothetical protein
MTGPAPYSPPTAPNKVSAADLAKTLDSLVQEVQGLARQQRLELNPEALYVYKPAKSGNGTALKLDLRLVPTYGDTGYVAEVKGGLFVELAAQEGEKNGFPVFGWKSETKVSAKLGIPDVTTMLVGLREVRLKGKPVPQSVRAKGDEKGISVGMFHRFGEETAAISLQFGADGSFFQVSKSATLRRSIKLSLTEEIGLEVYLRFALQRLLQLGVR